MPTYGWFVNTNVIADEFPFKMSSETIRHTGIQPSVWRHFSNFCR